MMVVKPFGHPRPPGSRRFWLSVLLLVGMGTASCGSPVPISVGFVGQFTGRNAALGVQGRNGAALAVKDFNAAGGVAGRPLELLTRNDAGGPADVVAADQSLIDAGVVALTGHMLSQEAFDAQFLLADQKMILASPTSALAPTSGQPDTIFQLVPSAAEQARALAERGWQSVKPASNTVGIIRDVDNQAFTQALADSFTEYLNGHAGTVIDEIAFSSSRRPNFRPLVEQLKAHQPGAVLIIASAPDTALIAQQMRILNWTVPMLASSWSSFNELIEDGGRAVANMVVASYIYPKCRTRAYTNFRNAYAAEYGQPPAFSAVAAYETIQVLARALQLTQGRAAGLKAALTQTGTWTGLCDTLVVDTAGHVRRPLYLVKIQNGHFIPLDPAPAP